MQGGQWQVLYLLRGLRECGHQQVLLARGELARRAAEDGFDVRTPGSYPPADIIHAHDAHAHTMAAMRSDRPLVVSRRVGFPMKRGMLSRWKYRRATHYIAISRFVADLLIGAGLKPEAISVVYDGVPMPAEVGFEPGGPIYGILKDPSTPILMAAGHHAGVEIHAVQNIENDMRNAGGLAYITNMQGLGSAAIFAMASGVPVVASRVGGLPEVVEHERTGLLVNNTVQEIAAALSRLVSEPALAARLAREGRLEALARFSAATMVEGTSRVYERLRG